MIIVPASSPALWMPALPVDSLAEIMPHLPAMRELMAKNGGVGLAAPQVGLSLAFFITDGRMLPSVVVNPMLIWESPETSLRDEGCLTWPGQFRPVRRAEQVTAAFLNAKGELKQTTFRGFDARVFLHEYDHLKGRCVFPKP